MNNPLVFPPGFHFGAATSAYQVEGSVAADGRGPSWWDVFAQQPGSIADGSGGDVACDHYNRWREDVDLMASFGLDAYRFSIAWPRVLPRGRGEVNQKGLDFYERLVDALLARGIAPYATLYHWDLPQALAERGGWQVRATAQAFADYAEIVMRRLGDRVHCWATINEPRCAAFVGHLEGRHAPGLRSLPAALCAAHHLLLAHGLGVQAMRAVAPRAKLGIVLDIKAHTPASPSDDDHAAVVRADGVFNRWFLDPLFMGRYPADVAAGFAHDMPPIGAGDLRTISQPIDALGLNYYTRGNVRHDGAKPFPHAGDVRVAGTHHSAMGWEDYPDGLYTMLMRIARQYMPAEIYVAENGCAEADVPSADGRVRDTHRERYLRGHLAAASQAAVGGVPLSAYLAWSLMDNFEWGHGYGKRFGLVYVDHATQRRIAKDSMLAYRELIAEARAAAARA